MKSKLLALFVLLFVSYVQGQNTLNNVGLTASTPAASAYSLRKLSNAYTGSAIQVRRSNDNATQDIGFNALGDLDTAALMSFVGNNDGFVTIWYDQSGNSRNLTQPTVNKQPTIVSGGVIKIKSNRPTVFFDTVDDGMLQAGADYLTSGDLSVNMVSGSNSYSTSLRRAVQGTNNWLIGPYQNLHSWFASDFNHQVNEPWLLYSTEVVTVVQPTGTPNTSWRNGVSVSSSNFKSYPNKIQLSSEGTYADEPFRGFISEVIAFNLELSTIDRVALETNQLAYYPVNNVDLKLSDLITIGNPLSPSFDSNTSNYTIPLLPNETESISIKPISSSNLTRWAIQLNSGDYQDIPTGIATDISIPPGVHTLFVTHLALDNTVVNTYSIAVERARATVNWTGATDTDWNTASNWDIGIPPINGSDVIIPGGLTNYPIVATDSIAHANSIIIQANASLTMNNGSNLEINGFTPDGYPSIQVYGQFTNSGNLTIGNRNTVGYYGIQVESGSFNNTTSGVININRTMGEGIHNTTAATISNSGNITIGSQASVGTAGMFLRNFTNNSTGNININRSSGNGFITTGTLINNGKITIGALSTVGTIGLVVTGGFTNGAGAEIKIDRCTSIGLRTVSNGNSTNNGKIVIGALSTGMSNAMSLARNFTNGSQGVIELDNYTASGIAAAGSSTFTFTNDGKITIGAIAAGSTGISSNFVFNNNSSGVIKIDRTSTSITSSTRNFTNSGKIIVGASNIGNNNVNMSSVCLNNACASFQILKGNLTLNGSSLTNNGLLQVKNTLNINAGKTLINNGILNYGTLNNSGTLENSTSASVILIDGLNPIFSYGATPYSGTIVGIYTDAQATVSAGTFTQPNTFTPIGLPNGLNPLYVKITPSGGACSYVFPFIYNLIEATHLNFDGVDDHITLPSANNIPSGNSNYTIEAWINPSEIGEKGIIGWGNYGQDNQVNALRLTPTGIKNFWWNNDLEVNYSFNTNTWYHVAASYNGSERKIYVNGILVGEDTLTIAHNVSNTSNLTIGLTNTNEFFNGSIDDVRIWNLERSESQIFNSKNCELQGNENGLVAYYKFNQGYNDRPNTGITSLTDTTANGNNGTLNNFTLNGSTSNWLSGHSMNQSTSSATAVSSCGTYTWPINNITYTSSGTYYFLTPCHTEILNLTIKQPTTSSMTQAACSSYTLNGTTYTASGTYTQTLTNAVGCDSTITLNLTIKQSTTSTTNVNTCSAYTWTNGVTYATSGTYIQALVNSQGCDSVATLNLTIAPAPSSSCTEQNMVGTNTYGNVAMGQSITASCSGSLTSVTIYTNNTTAAPSTITIRQGNAWNGTVLATQTVSSLTAGANVINFTTPTSVTAGSQYTIYIASSASGIPNLMIEYSDQYPGGQVFLGSATTTWDLKFQAVISGPTLPCPGECISPVVTTQPSNSNVCLGSNGSFTVSATDVQTYQWQVNTGSGFVNISNNATYSGATTATLNITAPDIGMSGYQYRCILGNLSPNTTVACSTTTASKTLTVNVSTTSTTNISACNTYTWTNGTTYTTSGVYSQTLVNSQGCDSVAALNLTIKHSTTSTTNISACNTYTWTNGVTYTTSGTRTQTLVNSQGCDSVATLNLTIKHSTTSTTNISACNTYTWTNGVTYTTSGTRTQTLVNSQGCDSVATLNLTIKHSTVSTTTISACNTYIWTNGTTYTTSGLYSQTLVNAQGCDSVATLNLTIKHSTVSTTTISACNTYTWTNGATYTTSGVYSQTLVNSQGCDSVATLNLTIKHSTASTTNISACNTYTWTNGTTYTTSGVYSQTLVNAQGCDSVATLNLTIKHSTTSTTNISVCNTYTWTNGVTYNTSGTHTQTLMNAAGCDSIATLNLTIKHSTASTTNISACNTYTWTNGATYTTSGVYSQTLVNSQGCDSVATLNLTIKHSTTSTTNISVCNTYTWTNGVTYNTSGTHTQTLMNAAGCDSIATLNLTINQPTENNITAVNCSSFTLNGTTYTASGTYIQHFTNAAGCDSAITLSLTITQPITSTTTITQCGGSYTWTNGVTYNTSGTHTQTLMNAAGCDSTATLVLTINALPVATATDNGNATITASSGSSYQWINCVTGVAIAGATTQTFTPSANGSYAVVISNSSECVDTSACVTINKLGIMENTSVSIAVFPNPTHNEVTVTMDASSATIEVVDAQGKLLQITHVISGGKVDLSTYETGVYFLRIQTENGSTLERIVKN